MSITIMGYVLIPIGILLLFFKIECLLFATILFSGFTASSIINFQNLGFSLQPSYYFVILYIFKYLFIVIYRTKIVKPNIHLFGFILTSFISLAMPIILKDKDILVMNVDGIISVLKFTKENITQFMYLIFCFTTYYFTKDCLNNKKELLDKCVKIYFLGAFIVCLLGIFQLICFQLGFPFDEIFRAGIHKNIQRGRMYSVAPEPSMFAFYIVPTMGLLLFSNNIINGVKQTGLLLILFISGLLSTSSTFLLGMLVFILLFVKRNFIKLNLTKKNLKYIKWFIIIGALSLPLIAIIIFNNEFVYEVLIQGTIDKILIKNKSGIERIESFIIMIKATFYSPFLGIGFGSSRSKDLFSTWLANTGCIGLGFFVFYIINIYRSLNKVYKLSRVSVVEGYIYFIAILVICAFVSVPEPYFLFIWINFSLVEVYINIYNSQRC